MKEHQHHIFLEAFFLAMVLFVLGLLLGVFIESGRTGNVANQYLRSEVNMLDIQIQTELVKQNGLECDLVIAKNIEFGNMVYEDAKLLEKYEESNRLTESELREQHRRYDILRTLFWLNSVEIKKKCNEGFHTVVYLYDYKPQDLILESKQRVYSKYLLDLKEQYGDSIMLIPIAKNMQLSSLDLILSKYNLNTTSIIIDEKFVIDSVEDLGKIDKILD